MYASDENPGLLINECFSRAIIVFLRKTKAYPYNGAQGFPKVHHSGRLYSILDLCQLSVLQNSLANYFNNIQKYPTQICC